MFDKIGKFLLKTNALNILSVMGIIATFIMLFSIVRLAETGAGVFLIIGFWAMVFIGVVLLLHAVYFYRIRNKPTQDSKFIKKLLSAFNVIGVFVIIASFRFMVAAAVADVLFTVLCIVLVIIMLNLAFTTNTTTKNTKND